ncbi:hypothetical protein GFL60_34435 [Rhizobium leguminosarum bv. viciae]|nr:hypothetical protein [Rhizobium leguminosarum bv. viciae]
MHIVVCIKQVPDSAQIRVHPVTNTIISHCRRRYSRPTILLCIGLQLRIDPLRSLRSLSLRNQSIGTTIRKTVVTSNRK